MLAASIGTVNDHGLQNKITEIASERGGQTGSLNENSVDGVASLIEGQRTKGDGLFATVDADDAVFLDLSPEVGAKS